MFVTIEKLIYGGEGLAHSDGATVFVPFVLPGEKTEAAAIERKKKFVRARLDRVIDASPERIAAPCPHFGVCGGCNYQHIPYEGQLEYKIEILRETLRRLGRVEWTGEIKAHASPPWNYRNRAQWKIRPLGGSGAGAQTLSVDTSGRLVENSPRKEGATGEGAAGKGAAGEANARADEGKLDSVRETGLGIGYFRANSTALCAVEECGILSPLLEKTLMALREAVAAGAFPRTLREIEAFADANDAKLLLTATFSGFPSRAAELAAKFREIASQIESLLFFDPTRDRMELFGPGYIEYETLGVNYRVGHFSFFQVNRFLVEDLALEVTRRNEMAGDQGGRLALDLFAGVGLFAVPLAKRFERVVAVESNPAAARDLESSLRGAGTIEVRAVEVEKFLERYKEKPDLVVLDPPRAGLEPGAIKNLVRMAPQWITYVSCEPPTLARDLAALREGGYDIADVQLFDLFPQTFHIETVVRLKRHA
jgi:23S rRNA (uracil1939-C5)-methyltransferase